MIQTTYNTTIPSKWIVKPHSKKNAAIRLFCFPYAGGGASLFREWARFSADIEVCAIQRPARENRLVEPAITDLPALINEVGQAIQPYLDKPFAFFGHSLGAIEAFELTHYLAQTQQAMPSYLFVSGCRAPQLQAHPDPIHNLPLETFFERIAALGGTPNAILNHQELLQLAEPSLRGDFKLIETYHYERRKSLTCPIMSFGGLNDNLVSQTDLTAWATQTQSLFEAYFYSGGHFFLHDNWQQMLSTMQTTCKTLVDRQ